MPVDDSDVTVPGDCWVWDGYIGECEQWHQAEWWTYMNVWTVSIVLVVFFACLAALFFVVGRWCK